MVSKGSNLRVPCVLDVRQLDRNKKRKQFTHTYINLTYISASSQVLQIILYIFFKRKSRTFTSTNDN